ncbi:DUF6011 domain-containing protein [Rapidithrix thailandica]|uniref:DUF6011 domain-containing protein n=1 Tax=Rapidithrix thailandica TaxID=413964 RepID=A0AAW9S9E5_9BACT
MSTISCARCGKTLLVEQSIERGIGPCCWQKILKDFNDPKEKRQMRMFAASYTYRVLPPNILLIIDQDQGGMSVTNDMDNVLLEIAENEALELENYRIAYCDSEGCWDGVKVDNGLRFYPIGVESSEEVLEYFSFHTLSH